MLKVEKNKTLQFKRFKYKIAGTLLLCFLTLAFIFYYSNFTNAFYILRFPIHTLCIIFKSCNIDSYSEIFISSLINSVIVERVFALNKEVLSQYIIQYLFNHRYAFCLLIFIGILLGGVYLYNNNHWKFKDVAQVCTGFFILITIFFTALNYEFSANKTKKDAQAIKETLTFNTAAEWHKTPVKDFELVLIQYEKQFISSKDVRNIDDFLIFLEKNDNITYKQALKEILNYLETVSIAAYRGLIDKDFIKEFHKSIFKVYYRDYAVYINDRRIKQDNETMWVNFTNLAEEWHPSIKADVLNGTQKSIVINNNPL